MRTLLPLLVALALAALPGSSVYADTPSPSFSCASASTVVERAICASPALAHEDAVMARLYAAAKRGARGDGQSGHGAAQLAWLKERAACKDFVRAAFPTRADCLMARYRDRNIELATAALFTNRDAALATLRRLDPAGATLLEALTIYALQPGSSNWSSPALRQDRARIAELLGPPWRQLGGDPAQGYGSGILASDGIVSLDDALKSPATFAQTIKVLATYAEGARTPLLFPCEVLLRHPDMIELEQPLYGSSLDNALPQSNCEAVLPPAPRLAVLDRAIWDSWPECDGTIRYLFYRAYGAKFDAVLLGQPAARAFSKRPMPRRKGISATALAAVQQELAARYAAFGYAPSAARATARERLVDMLSTAHKCG
ncbi:lysozyme inhibitor LprI family protein [Novosphingobium sp.]|uniref:lysozyme inhibitor LprI family protein n=1 Tax=Novosphingobium sp. TaxID=1874826 RepID=UPI0034246DFC